MEVTLQDIAKELDVSATTVSRSLRHDTTINPETRARVNEAARRLGYKSRVRRPRRAIEHDTNHRALGLLMRHSSLDSVQHDSNLMKMMAGIMSIADKQGMHLKVHPWQSQEPRHRDEAPSLAPPFISEGNYQALIVHGEQEERDLAFLSHRMPVVSMGRSYRDLPIDAAVADNTEGIYRLVAHLVELGHRRLAWVGAFYSSSFIEERKTGFLKGCLEHGLEIDLRSFFGAEIYTGFEIHTAAPLLKAISEGTTGFVCGNDGIALEVVKVLEAAGVRVPLDVSVTGFDASYPLQPGSRRQPTSIDPHFFEIGQVAARLALQRLSQPLAQPCIVSVRGDLVAGDSVAPLCVTTVATAAQ